MKLILGFVGEIASGKGTATKHLVNKYNASSHRFSTPIRKICDVLYLEQSREIMQKLSATLRANISEDIFAKVIAEDVKNDTHEMVVVDGIRRPADIKYLKELPNFYMISVQADEMTRYQRLIERRENSDDAKKTLEQFRAQAQEEPEQKIREIAAKADFIIDNNGAPENTQKQIDALVNKLRK
jgi:dephospho-CoA kinase